MRGQRKILEVEKKEKHEVGIKKILPKIFTNMYDIYTHPTV